MMCKSRQPSNIVTLLFFDDNISSRGGISVKINALDLSRELHPFLVLREFILICSGHLLKLDKKGALRNPPCLGDVN